MSNHKHAIAGRKHYAALFIVAFVAFSGHSAGSSALAMTPHLWWTAAPKDAVPGVNGLTFSMAEGPRVLHWVFTFANRDSDADIILPGGFLNDVLVVVRHDDVAVRMSLEWDSPVLHTAAAVAPVRLDENLVLPPDAWLDVTLRMQREDGEAFDDGHYTVGVRIGSAVSRLRLRDGEAWSGRYVGEAEFGLRIGSPRDSEELRRHHLNEGHRLLSSDDAVSALSHFEQVLNAYPNDVSANVGAGRALIELNRFGDAVAAFERALPRLRGIRSEAFGLLAYAHIVLRNDAEAERVLRESGMSDQRIASELAHARTRARMEGHR